MNVKEYLKSLLKYNGNSKGLNQTAKITFKEKEKKAPKAKLLSSNKDKAVPKEIDVDTKKVLNDVETVEIEKSSKIKLDNKPVNPTTESAPSSKEQNQVTEITKESPVWQGLEHTTDEVWNPCINKTELSSINKSDGMMITIGLDFGTHQTKVCIESKGGVEINYTFMKFGYNQNQMFYTLPSIIGVCNDGKLKYGHLPRNFDGQIIRYFKQAVFRGKSLDGTMDQDLSYYYSIWYIAYILFDLEEIFGQNFSIQMGAPTDSSHIRLAKQIATRIIASSYKLVEDVFENNKEKFLDTDIDTLKGLTEIVEYSDDVKEEYGLLVFPEAYACLKPLISQKKIEKGMNLMIDIGGGTTDISFFTIENDNPQVYDFFSINKGLNYLTCAEEQKVLRLTSNIKYASEIDNQRKNTFKKEVKNICSNIQTKLLREFTLQTSLNKTRLLDALKNRPLVYCGGGSTFQLLRTSYIDFSDIKQISEKEWDTKSVPQIKDIKKRSLFPILSTAYGLAISTEHDDIIMKPFKDIFEKIRGAEEESRTTSIYDRYNHGFNYTDDYDAIK
jgi:hypothetical protein